MAETQQRQPTNRPVSGKEMLQRMLQLEKQSQHRRLNTASMVVTSVENPPSRPTPPQRGHRSSSMPPQKPQQVQTRSLSPNRPMSHPPISLAIPPPEPAKEADSSAKLEAETDSDVSSTAEICGSPSWSDFGGSKKKKEKKRLERERKELEKRLKKLEKEKQAAAKAGKRLSKRPPAAMETQRMPTALRTSTIPQADSTAAPQDNSTTSSRRNSIAHHTPTSEIASATNSAPPAKSKPASSPHSHKPTVGSTVSQLPKLAYILRGESRSESISPEHSTTAECDEQYIKNHVSFASQLDASAIDADAAEPQRVNLGKTRRVSFSIETTRPALPSRSITMANVTDASRVAALTSKEEQPEIETRARHPSNSSVSSVSFRGKQDGREGGYKYPSFAIPRSNEITGKEAGAAAGASKSARYRSDLSRRGQMGSPREERVSLDTFRSLQSLQSTDGGSYVQRHRMHQQQRSIAGLEDELALESASKLTDGWDIVDIEKQRWPPTPSDSTESLDQLDRKDSTQRGSEDDPQVVPVEEEEDQYHAFLATQSRHSVAFDRQPSSPSPSPKKEKLLDFRRRPKLASPSTSTTSTNTVTQKSNVAGSPIRTVTPPSPVSPATVALVSKISKAERIFGEAVPDPPSPPPRSANRWSQQIASKWGIEPVRDFSETSTTSVGFKDQPKPLTISLQDLTVSATSKARPKLPKFSTTPDLSQKWAESSTLPSVKAKQDEGNVNTSKDTPEARTSKPVPQVVVEGIDGDGATHKTSLKRSRSNPQLQDAAVSQDLSFLPELKHQALVKPTRKSPTSSLASSRSSYGGNTSSDKSSSHSPPQFPAPSPPSTRPSSDDGISLPVGASSLNFAPKAGSLLRPGAGSRRSTMSTKSFITGAGSAAAAANQMKPLAKMFVICCKCKYWHDLPSRLYEAMAMPIEILDADPVAESANKEEFNTGKGGDEGTMSLV
ncbi:MAG: hypothetical protein M1830_009079 [Pleopsidium flavum]|nr:MAG: hypothetical protein M1830_009079 [Pleopsidium flavum]